MQSVVTGSINGLQACRTGAFGTVTKEVLDGSREVAVKRMDGRVDNVTLRCFATEIDIMKRCR